MKSLIGQVPSRNSNKADALEEGYSRNNLFNFIIIRFTWSNKSVFLEGRLFPANGSFL